MNKEEICKFIAEGLSTRTIAKRCNCSQSNVKYWLRKWNLKTLHRNPRIAKSYLCKCGETDSSKFYGHNKGRCRYCYKIKYTERHVETRNLTLNLLGDSCITCGLEDKRALQIDHVNDNGAEERKGLSVAKYYSIVLDKIKAGSKEYQLLCANCNTIKEWERSSIRKSTSLLS